MPKVIHYCWFGGGPLPQLAQACLASWRTQCPDYEIRRWDETNLDVQQCRFSREAIAAGAWAFVSDWARVRIVHDHGGIYLDTDVELVQPLDDLLHWQAFFGFQHDGTVNTGLGFGAEQGHRVVAALLAGYETTSFVGTDGCPVKTPCPERDSVVFEQFGFRLDGSFQDQEGVAVLPPEYLCPKSFESGRVTLTPLTHAIHHFHASWHSTAEAADVRRRRMYARLFGLSLGARIYRLDLRARNRADKCRLLPRVGTNDASR